MENINENNFLNDLLTPMHQIHTFANGNSLFLGSQSAVGGFPDKWNYNADDYENVKNQLDNSNIKSIVCCAELIKLYDNFEYLHIPMESNDDFNINDSCIKAWEWINNKINEGSVLVHCNAGCHRSATIVVGYLSYKLNEPLVQSYNYVRLKRSCINLDNFMGKLENVISKINQLTN
jgi:protein-tyrosine phosphatase